MAGLAGGGSTDDVSGNSRHGGEGKEEREVEFHDDCVSMGRDGAVKIDE